MVRERTRAGLAAARDRGAKVGRPAKLSPHQQQEIIRTVRDGSKTAGDAARLFGLHRLSITRLLARAVEVELGARDNLRKLKDKKTCASFFQSSTTKMRVSSSARSKSTKKTLPSIIEEYLFALGDFGSPPRLINTRPS